MLNATTVPSIMFYQPGKTPHNLPHDPFKACVVPRPIGWISTVSPPTLPSSSSRNRNDATTTPKPQHNLAPYSQFNNLTFDPPYVMFAANQTSTGTRKDTVRNAEATGKFVWNLATWDLRQAVNATAQQFAYGTDEFLVAGLEKEYSHILPGDPVPMVKASPAKFECVYHSTVRLPGNPPMGTVDVVIGRVVGVHIADWALTKDGRLDVKKTKPMARLGYYEYAVVTETFEMVIPGADGAISAGLEGSPARVLEEVRRLAKPKL
ncbi:hypothetical protein B0H63DRAFT_480818 [Podospora didyma]|uniref:Flavin reductase like domain-containing protein n=1 Tax=Podospora didyma TaxID=330526 RepID=A0AAE0N967_9PEZI|nr:hypothetical protein B0H63DRAFT_480818 [Podospora didyma]